MGWSLTGISYPVECVYTQHTGFEPDVALLRCNPQVGALPAYGTLSLTWGATTITLPNCTIDTASVQLTEDGRFIQLKALDRRDLWTKVAPISGEYNTVRAGAYITGRQKTLRELGEILMDALGETSADVSILPTTIYPPVSWESEDVVKAARDLFEQYGYSVVLGFGSEAVEVVQIGDGASLSTTNAFVASDTIDAKTPPRYVRTCFGRSVMQCRLKLEAVGREADGTWLPIDDLSYKPADGWEKTPPFSLSTMDTLTGDDYTEATGYVRRAYRVVGFADGTWDVPDGSGTISGLTDILPLENRVLDTEDVRPDFSYQPYRIYGKYWIDEEDMPAPITPGGVTTAISDRIESRNVWFDGENGLIIFEKPMFWVDAGDYKAAELYLECTIGIRNQTNFSWNRYEYDVEVVPTGVGYHTVRLEQRAETIVQYDTSHVVTGTTTNQTTLDALGDAWAVAVAATYAATSGQYIAYYEPKLSLRCDGAILQVQHILTCGEHGHAVNRTIASRQYEFDRGIPTRSQRIARLQATESAVRLQDQTIRGVRKDNTDD